MDTEDGRIPIIQQSSQQPPSIGLLLNPPLSQTTYCVNGRIYIITGGTQGLGLAIARLLQQQGAAGLILVSRNQQLGKQISAELTSDTCVCYHIVADLQNIVDVQSIVPKALERLGESTTILPKPIVITGLVNAAATCARGNLLTETADGFDAHYAINVRAPFLLTQAVAKHIIDNNNKSTTGGGSIVNICSCAVYGGAPFVMAYSAMKAALATMTKTNAHELAKYNIRVNAINMGWCYTDNENIIQSERNVNWLADADASVPLGRILRPHDVACLVNFLLSDAAVMMTASVIQYHPEYPYGMISLATNENDGR